MDALDRFRHLRKKLWRKLGVSGPMPREVHRHLSQAASIELVLETSRHEALLGKKFDPEMLAALRERLGVALVEATIALQAAKHPID
jgi:hypothetical protein